MSKSICPECNSEMFEYQEPITKKILFNCNCCKNTFELRKLSKDKTRGKTKRYKINYDLIHTKDKEKGGGSK